MSYFNCSTYVVSVGLPIGIFYMQYMPVDQDSSKICEMCDLLQGP